MTEPYGTLVVRVVVLDDLSIYKIIRFACGYQRSTFIPGGDV